MNQNLLTIDSEKIAQLALYNLQNRRSYASFFEWKNPNDRELGKKVKERSVACDLIKSLEKDTESTLFQTVRYGENPPDVVAIDINRNLVGFEVTELVDENTVKLWSQKLRNDKEWEMEEVIKKIERILRKKSQKLAASPHKKIFW